MYEHPTTPTQYDPYSDGKISSFSEAVAVAFCIFTPIASIIVILAALGAWS